MYAQVTECQNKWSVNGKPNYYYILYWYMICSSCAYKTKGIRDNQRAKQAWKRSLVPPTRESPKGRRRRRPRASFTPEIITFPFSFHAIQLLDVPDRGGRTLLLRTILPFLSPLLLSGRLPSPPLSALEQKPAWRLTLEGRQRGLSPQWERSYWVEIQSGTKSCQWTADAKICLPRHVFILYQDLNSRKCCELMGVKCPSALPV